MENKFQSKALEWKQMKVEVLSLSHVSSDTANMSGEPWAQM